MAIQETRTLPAQFVEDLGTDLAKQLVAQTGVPVVSTGVAGISQQPGETADQFAARQKAAEQFQIRQQSLSGLAPQVASQDPLQQQAQTLATQGIGSYQPFLQAAQQATGPQAYQDYMSPYQQQVIDVSLAEFDRNKAIQEKQIADQAIAAGAFGGGREGVQRAEFQTGVPVVSTGIAGISQQPGEDAAQFAARQKAAEQFQIRQQSLSGLAPQVAAQDPLQVQAQQLAQQGIGSYQPFLQAAQQATGPQAYQAYMSPYQQQVIDVSLAEFDRNKAIQEQQIRDQAVASGAFGGGREGVALAEYGKASDLNRAQLQAGLLQQGFGQAQALAAQQYGQQTGLASLLPGLQSQDVSQLGTLGAINQAQAQAQLDAQREAARQATYLPQEQLQQYAGAVTGIMGGYPAAFQSTNVPNPTPLQTALGVGTTLAGIYGSVKNAGVNPFK